MDFHVTQRVIIHCDHFLISMLELSQTRPMGALSKWLLGAFDMTPSFPEHFHTLEHNKVFQTCISRVTILRQPLLIVDQLITGKGMLISPTMMVFSFLFVVLSVFVLYILKLC